MRLPSLKPAGWLSDAACTQTADGPCKVSGSQTHAPSVGALQCTPSPSQLDLVEPDTCVHMGAHMYRGTVARGRRTAPEGASWAPLHILQVHRCRDSVLGHLVEGLRDAPNSAVCVPAAFAHRHACWLLS